MPDERGLIYIPAAAVERLSTVGSVETDLEQNLVILKLPRRDLDRLGEIGAVARVADLARERKERAERDVERIRRCLQDERFEHELASRELQAQLDYYRQIAERFGKLLAERS